MVLKDIIKSPLNKLSGRMADASVIYGLAAMFGYGIAAAMVQVPARRLGSQQTILFRDFLIGGLLGLIILLSGQRLVFSPFHIAVAIVTALIGYAALTAYYSSLRKGRVGVLTTLSNTSAVFTILLALIFLNESLNPLQQVAVVLTILGSVLLSLDMKELKGLKLSANEGGVFLALVSAVLFGLFFFLVKIPVSVLGPLLTAFVVEVTIFVITAARAVLEKLPLGLPDRKLVFYFFVIAIMNIIALVSYNTGIQQGAVSLVAAVVSASTFISVLYGKIIYKEQLRLSQYFFIVVIVAGLALMSV